MKITRIVFRENKHLIFMVEKHSSDLKIFSTLSSMEKDSSSRPFHREIFARQKYSLSRREESCKHKLSDCLLVCPHFTDWSKKNVITNGTILHKT